MDGVVVRAAWGGPHVGDAMCGGPTHGDQISYAHVAWSGWAVGRLASKLSFMVLSPLSSATLLLSSACTANSGG